MKESMWGYALILLGIGVSTFMIMISNMTTTNQQDYYLLKEITNAAMIDAIDYGYYKAYGETKINTEKFVENFIRRFAEAVSKTNTYKIDFYNIYENPPSVSIKVTSQTGDYHIFGDSTNIDVVNSIDAILEANNTPTFSAIYYSVPYGNCYEQDHISEDYPYCHLANRAEIKQNYNSDLFKDFRNMVENQWTDMSKTRKKTFDPNKVKIASVEYLSTMSSEPDLNNYDSNYFNMYNRARTSGDVPDAFSDERYLTQDVKNVRITLNKKTVEGKVNYYLAYGLDFTCGDANVYGKEDVPGKQGIIKEYRKKPSLDQFSTSGELTSYNSTYSSADAYKDEDGYNNLTSAEKDNYEPTPYYNNCLIGIKYKVNFYYDE